ncbi:MAG: NTP transferase domain-containing protein [Candidatus Cloacimonetes bacterium]|nr:NTP transferase domain-containing protein [Candidatus Cloacimonadota bacterium]
MSPEKNENVNEIIKEYSSGFDYNIEETAIILAAGHGKRIKSHKSKMLHSIWGVPTVERVYTACRNGLQKVNAVVVVGIKAPDVIKAVGKRENTLFANQSEQLGTGHAVQVAIEEIDRDKLKGVVYVLPGDMGLIDEETMQLFRDEFIKSESDMMVLTGLYEGDPVENSYGRIIRVKEEDLNGDSSGSDNGKVIKIMENKDIHALSDTEHHILEFNRKKYSYTKKELIANNEFNSGVYAFKKEHLMELLFAIDSNNAQKEIYITDLIDLFNKKGYTVGAVSPRQQHVIMGFNNKSVLKEMEAIARKLAYDKIKDLVLIDDPDDFYIAEEVIDQIVEMDRIGTPLDISIGKGVHIGRGVELNYNLNLHKNVFVNGNVKFGKNVTVWEGVHLSCFGNQTFTIGNNVEILWGDIIKGNIVIGDGSRIESSVNMTGSDDFPLRIGSNVTIKGTSYLFGTTVEDDLFIEHSVLIKRKVNKILKSDGTVQPVKFVLPMPEGLETLE